MGISSQLNLKRSIDQLSLRLHKNHGFKFTLIAEDDWLISHHQHKRSAI